MLADRTRMCPNAFLLLCCLFIYDKLCGTCLSYLRNVELTKYLVYFYCLTFSVIVKCFSGSSLQSPGSKGLAVICFERFFCVPVHYCEVSWRSALTVRRYCVVPTSTSFCGRVAKSLVMVSLCYEHVL